MSVNAILGTIKWSNDPNEADTALALVMQASVLCIWLYNSDFVFGKEPYLSR